MRVECVDVDSSVIGRKVLSLYEFDPNADFPAFECSYRHEYDPVYVSCKIPLENIAEVHALERHGFNLIECQIRSTKLLRKPYEVARYNFDFLEVTSETELTNVLDIAATTFTHDRFSVDHELGTAISGKRYQEYVRKSFRSPNEAVYRLVNRSTGQTVAFKTHLYQGNNEVLCLQGGVRVEKVNLGLGVVNDYFEQNELIRKGIKRITTHISASNLPIFNLEIGDLGFRVIGTFAVLRKIYGQTR